MDKDIVENFDKGGPNFHILVIADVERVLETYIDIRTEKIRQNRDGQLRICYWIVSIACAMRVFGAIGVTRLVVQQ